MTNPKPPTRPSHPTPPAVATQRADDPSETRERIANAWAELLEAAKTDPKARAFLAAFGPADAMLHVAAPASPDAASAGPGSRRDGGDGGAADASPARHVATGHGGHAARPQGGAGQEGFEAAHAPGGDDRE
jgi:hypothetical protein